MSFADRKTSLIFCEPSTFDYKNDYIVLDIDSEMLKLIREGAQPYQDSDGNAYIFGHLYDVDMYDHPGFVDVSDGQIGFIEQNLARRKDKAGQLSSDYEKQIGPVKYNDPVYLSTVRKSYPEIMWIGQIFGKPNGVHLHFHVDDEFDRVDSIIIDNEYFFKAHYDSADEVTDDDTDASDNVAYVSGDSYHSEDYEADKNNKSDINSNS